jgi:hypothetical protein
MPGTALSVFSPRRGEYPEGGRGALRPSASKEPGPLLRKADGGRRSALLDLDSWLLTLSAVTMSP